jgi:hypothetical protein
MDSKVDAVTEVATKILVRHANAGNPLSPLEAMTLVDNLKRHSLLCEMVRGNKSYIFFAGHILHLL